MQLMRSVQALGLLQLGDQATLNPAPTPQDRGSKWAGFGFLENSLGRTAILIGSNNQDLRAWEEAKAFGAYRWVPQSLVPWAELGQQSSRWGGADQRPDSLQELQASKPRGVPPGAL